MNNTSFELIIKKINKIQQEIISSKIEPHTFISQSQFDILMKEIKIAEKRRNESCGLLIGGLIPSINRILITKILIPPAKDKKEETIKCELSIEYLRKMTNQYYKNKQETIIGRWHLHYDLEFFSSIDINGVKDFLSLNNLLWHPYHVELLVVKRNNDLKLFTTLFIPNFKDLSNEDIIIINYNYNPTIILPDTVFNTLKPWFWEYEEVKRVIGQLSSNKKWKNNDVIQSNDAIIIKTKDNKRILYFPQNYSPAFLLKKKQKTRNKKRYSDYELVTDLDAFLSLYKKQKNKEK